MNTLWLETLFLLKLPKVLCPPALVHVGLFLFLILWQVGAVWPVLSLMYSKFEVSQVKLALDSVCGIVPGTGPRSSHSSVGAGSCAQGSVVLLQWLGPQF